MAAFHLDVSFPGSKFCAYLLKWNRAIIDIISSMYSIPAMTIYNMSCVKMFSNIKIIQRNILCVNKTKFSMQQPTAIIYRFSKHTSDSDFLQLSKSAANSRCYFEKTTACAFLGIFFLKQKKAPKCIAERCCHGFP